MGALGGHWGQEEMMVEEVEEGRGSGGGRRRRGGGGLGVKREKTGEYIIGTRE